MCTALPPGAGPDSQLIACPEAVRLRVEVSPSAYPSAERPEGRPQLLAEELWLFPGFDGHPSGGLTRDRILDNLPLYWVTNTSTSAARLYWESFRTIYAAIASGQKPPELKLPVAFTVSPGEIFQAPRSWAEKVYPNLIYFNEAEKGGHFADVHRELESASPASTLQTAYPQSASRSTRREPAAAVRR
jgi:hypothetical protein